MSLLDEFYIRLGADSQLDFHETFMPAQYEGKLYHYTSPAGLTSILFNDPQALTLWASRYDTLNDALEGEMALEVYRKVCASIESEKKISIDLESIRPTRTLLMQSNINGKIKTTRPECERYICCFSRNPDSLPMWNYYAKGNAYEGYNIGVDIESLNLSLTQEYQNIEVSSKTYPVIYDETEQEKLVRSFMQKVLSKYTPEYDYPIRYVISNQLAMWQLLFKNKCFEHENEVRVIVSVAKSTSTKESPLEIKYRTNGMFIIPYIEVKLNKKCVSSIMMGPQQWNERQKRHQVEIIKGILSKHQYTAKVECSEVPVRY